MCRTEDDPKTCPYYGSAAKWDNRLCAEEFRCGTYEGICGEFHQSDVCKELCELREEITRLRNSNSYLLYTIKNEET